MNTCHKTIRCAVHLAAAAALLLICGCASIVDSGTPKISINSSPEGAKVTVFNKGGQVVTNGVTPFVASLKRSRGYFQGASYRLVFELAGHKQAEATVVSKVNGWYIGNIFFGGVLGMLIVDPATGAMWSLHPTLIEQPLDKEQSAAVRDGTGLVVMLKEHATAGELGNLRPIYVR